MRLAYTLDNEKTASDIDNGHCEVDQNIGSGTTHIKMKGISVFKQAKLWSDNR